MMGGVGVVFIIDINLDEMIYIVKELLVIVNEFEGVIKLVVN